MPLSGQGIFFALYERRKGLWKGNNQIIKKMKKRACQNEWDMVEYFLSERERFR